MIDTQARSILFTHIQDYLNKNIKAFEFDEKITSIETKDASVQQLVYDLWYYYDDINDHDVRLDRYGWNFMQRVLLFLKSEHNLEIVDRYRQNKRVAQDRSRLIAGSTLAAQLIAIITFPQLWPLFTALGAFVSIPICKWRSRCQGQLISETDTKRIEDHFRIYYPFRNFRDLMRARRMADFRKKPYPKSLHQNCSAAVLDRSTAELAKFSRDLCHLILSPVILAYCCREISEVVIEPVDSSPSTQS